MTARIRCAGGHRTAGIDAEEHQVATHGPRGPPGADRRGEQQRPVAAAAARELMRRGGKQGCARCSAVSRSAGGRCADRAAGVALASGARAGRAGTRLTADGRGRLELLRRRDYGCGRGGAVGGSFAAGLLLTSAGF